MDNLIVEQNSKDFVCYDQILEKLLLTANFNTTHKKKLWKFHPRNELFQYLRLEFLVSGNVTFHTYIAFFLLQTR